MSGVDAMWMDEIATFATKRWDGGKWASSQVLSRELLAATDEPEEILAHAADAMVRMAHREMEIAAGEAGVPLRDVVCWHNSEQVDDRAMDAVKVWGECRTGAVTWMERPEWQDVIGMRGPAVPAERARRAAEPRWGVVGHEELGTFSDTPEGVSGELAAIAAAWQCVGPGQERPAVRKVG